MLYTKEFTCSPDADLQKKLREAIEGIPVEDIISIVQRDCKGPGHRRVSVSWCWVVIYKGGPQVFGE